MAVQIKKWLRQYLLTSFYFLAFLLTWLAWIPQTLYSRGNFPFDHFLFYLVGGMGLMLAVYCILRAEYGKNLANAKLFALLFSWKRSPLWYSCLIVLAGILTFLPFILSQKNSPLTAIFFPSIFSFAKYFIAAIPEELAWRGFALPRLQRRFSALFSSIIMGLLWGLWHLPLLFNLNNPMSDYHLAAWFLDTLAQAIIYVWLFNSTRGSVFLLVVFHAIMNYFGHFHGWSSTIVTAAAAFVLVLTSGAATLSTIGEKVIT